MTLFRFNPVVFLSRFKNSLPILFVLFFVLILNLGSISSNNYFFADDWGWFYRAEFSDFSEFPIIPTQIYNDRPVGEFILRAMFIFFEFDYVSIHYLIFLLHLINVFLIYKLMSQNQKEVFALLTSFFFGIWYPSNFAIGWIAAIFDLVCTTFILGAILSFMKYIEKENKGFLIFSLILQIFAIRTKEFGILTPLFVSGFLLLNYQNLLVKKYRALMISFAISTFYGIVYIFLLIDEKRTNSGSYSSGSYSFSLDSESIIVNLRSYFSILFFRDEKIVYALLIIVFVSFLITRNLVLLRNAAVYLLLFLASLVPFLILPNQFSELYLYFPHVFIIAAFCDHLNFVNQSRALALALCIVISLAGPLSEAHESRIRDYEQFAHTRDQFAKFVEFESQREPVESYFIDGVKPYLNPFSYGPGSSVRLLHKDESITIFLEMPSEILVEKFCKDSKPKRFYKYTNDELSDETLTIKRACPVN